MAEAELNTVVCPNCEYDFDQDFDFCPHCGQQNKKLQLKLKHFLHDFISSSFNLDSKIFRTLQLLIFYPGKLTKLFLAGKRTSYIPPVRLYLIISLVYFTLLSFTGNDMVKWSDTGDGIDAIDSTMVSNNVDIDTSSHAITTDSLDSVGTYTTKTGRVVTFDNLGEDEKEVLDLEIDSITNSWADDESGWGEVANNRLKKLNTKEGKDSFKVLLQKYTSLGMFILMPITALLFFALFWKNTYYIQHLVFVLHLQSMMYVLFIVTNLIGLLSNHFTLELTTILLFFFILFIWVKKFYEISWRKTIWKSLLFLLMYGFCFSLFFVVVASISAYNL